MLVRIGHRYENVDSEKLSEIKGEVVWNENAGRYCFVPYRTLFQSEYNEKREINVL